MLPKNKTNQKSIYKNLVVVVFPRPHSFPVIAPPPPPSLIISYWSASGRFRGVLGLRVPREKGVVTHAGGGAKMISVGQSLHHIVIGLRVYICIYCPPPTLSCQARDDPASYGVVRTTHVAKSWVGIA